MRTRLKQLLVLLAILSLPTTARAAQEGFARAKELYHAAFYEDALGLLDELADQVSSPADQQRIQQYRALCLLALDRTDEAAQTVAEMVDQDPLYTPNPEQLPPRFLSVFERVRRDRLPALIRERYAAAKTAFAEGRFPDAQNALDRVVKLVEDFPPAPDGRADEPQREMLAIQTDARQLMETIRADSEQPGPEHIYSSTDAGIVPPAPIRSEIPAWRPAFGDGRSFQGELELVIDRSGNVQSARLVTPINPAYDPVLLDAARQWTFRAATKDKQPVPYRTRMMISLAPQRKQP